MKRNKYAPTLLFLTIVLALSFSGCKMLSSDEKSGDKAEVEPLEYSFYSGYWEIDLSANPKSSSYKVSGTQNFSGTFPITSKAIPDQRERTASNGYHLQFYKLSGWTDYINVSNSGSGESEIAFGDDIYINYAVANAGSEIFSVYLNASDMAEVTIAWDGEVYDVIPIEQLQANYYQTRTIQLDNFYGDLDFSPGIHEVELTLDVPGQSPQTVERTVDIKAPDIMAESFEFTESMYFIENDGYVTYGNLSFRNNTLTLHGYGSLEIVEENGDVMIVEVTLDGVNKQSDGSGFQISLRKQQPPIQDTKMTNLLCHDPWVLVKTTSTNTPEGEEWMFHRSGNYDFININTGFSRKAWGYDSETSINYGFSQSQLNGTTEILELNRDYMVMDDGFNTFEFER